MKKVLLAVLSVVFLLPMAAQAQGPYNHHPYRHRYRHCYWRHHHRNCYWR